MAQDLAAIVPPAIVCAAFLIGVGVLLRRELAPKRRAGREGDTVRDEPAARERDEPSET